MTTYECLMPNCRLEVYRPRDVCEPCWQDRRSQLTALPELYAMNYALLTPGSRLQEITTIHVEQPASSMPFSLVIFDTLEQAFGVIAGWGTWVRQKANVPYIPAHTTGKRFALAVYDLTAYDYKIANAEYAGTYVMDVWTVYRRLVVQCLPTAPRHLSIACPVCDHATVLTRHADEFAACLTCATVWPHSQLPIMSKRGRAA